MTYQTKYIFILHNKKLGHTVWFTDTNINSVMCKYIPGPFVSDHANTVLINFMVIPCINNIQHFIFQLMHTTLENAELLKHFKIRKTAPCFGLQGNNHQGATVST